MDAIPGSPLDWIISPTALQRDGESRFKSNPVGAGPLVVSSDTPSIKLVLKRNPRYLQKGRPYLNGLRFETVGFDESGYASLLSGQAQVYLDFTSFGAVKRDRQQVNVVPEPAIYGPYLVRVNTSKPPFNNLLAREAIYFATNPGPISKALTFGHGQVSESLSIPGGLYYEKNVPGYRSYDLAKAKALVRQLGGLHVDLEALDLQVDKEVDEALASEWKAAGITTTLGFQPSSAYLSTFQSGQWEAYMGNFGGYDPALNPGLAV